MTLELNQVAPQVKAMGRSLAEQNPLRDAAGRQAQALLQQFSTNQSTLHERIRLAEKVQQKLRFDWVGAAPTAEALGQAYPLPPCPERVTVIASDGSQILPSRHAITLYYLVNIGSIVYRHGSNQKPETYNPKPLLCYAPDELLDAQGRLISPGEVNVKRDLAELGVLADLAPAYTHAGTEPVVALMDGRLTLRVIDLPFDRQEACQNEYIELLHRLRETQVLPSGYVDRPRSTFVLALLHLASLDPAAITEENLRQNPFRHLTDLDLFTFLDPGERSAIFTIKAKNVEKYSLAGHAIHFFYLNVGSNQASPNLARVEIPAWVAANPQSIDLLHATLVRQARITGSYPYVLSRAHELAIISGEEREAVEMMLAVEMRRQGLLPALSPKEFNKTLLTGKEGFRL
ncbi:MAG: DNA double-strand break repair nuclease NurA [Anaerolineae bacterium]|nr:DNA double-strand break repair nuclease NurA [Anaerolineae bacterium]